MFAPFRPRSPYIGSTGLAARQLLQDGWRRGVGGTARDRSRGGSVVGLERTFLSCSDSDVSGSSPNHDEGKERRIDLTVTPLAGSLGAEVSGVDLTAPVDPATRDALRAAWLDHLVLVFRDQPLELDAFEAFARLFGEPVEYPFVPGLPGHPRVIEVAKLPHEKVNFGGIWHSDTTYLEQPPKGTTLIAREVPPSGGDTLFANQYAAFEALSPGMQEMLLPLRAVFSSSLADVSATREDRRRDAAAQGYDSPAEDYEAVHPVVRTHPETGRRSLFVHVAHTARFEGMTEQESKPLLHYLFEHQVRPEFTFRLRWQVGTIALWDNRCCLHNPINDYHGHTRVMHRITLAGDRPG